MDNYLLSVVIPVHDLHGRYKNLKSWVLQPLSTSIQIIFVLDEVNESAILEFRVEILNQTPNRYVLVSENFGGPGSSRNYGMQLATGKYLAFIDSDDIPSIEEYFQLIKKMEDSGAELGIGSFQTVDSVTGSTQEETFGTNSLEMNLRLLSKKPGLWRMIFTRSLIQGIEFPQLRMGEDQVFIVQALQNVTSIEFSSKPIYRYYINQKNQLTMSKIAISDISMSIHLLGKILKQKKLKWRSAIELMYLKMFISRLIKAEGALSIKGLFTSIRLLRHLGYRTTLRLLPACFRLIK